MIRDIRSALKKTIPSSIWRRMRGQYHTARRFIASDLRYKIAAQFNPQIHQTTAFTAMDRYPEAFSIARELLNSHGPLRILSFGCSTGEEVFTLRKYFPEAIIVGAERNKSRLKTCRSKNADDQISFIESVDSNIQKHGPYNAIFAMAVLQRTPHEVAQKGVRNLSSIYKFSSFNDQLKKFDEVLMPGGLIIIQNSQYRFRDSDIFGHYRVRGYANPRDLPSSFDRNGSLISAPPYNEIVFQKNTVFQPRRTV